MMQISPLVQGKDQNSQGKVLFQSGQFFYDYLTLCLSPLLIIVNNKALKLINYTPYAIDLT